jgi:hypothetical protein
MRNPKTNATNEVVRKEMPSLFFISLKEGKTTQKLILSVNTTF